MALINDADTLRQHVANGPTDGVDFDRLKPIIRTIEREYVLSLFPEIWINRWSDEGLDSQLNETELMIKSILREGLGHLVTWKYAKTGAVLLTGSGMQKMENEHFTSAFKDDKQEFKEDHEASGLSALESALYYAVRYKADLTGFDLTEAYEKATEHFVNFTADFEAAKYRISYKTFAALTPIIALIEAETVVPLLGASFYESLKMEQYNSLLALEKRKLLKYLREGVGQYAVKLAMEMNLVTMEGNQVMVRELKNSNDVENRTAPRRDLYEHALMTREAYAFRYFRAANNFLLENADVLAWIAPAAKAGYTSTRTEIGLKSL
jgi:hypothetical protein